MEMSQNEQILLVFALRHPRGRYPVERAAQLSGVPRSTLYDWRRRGVYLPDFGGYSPVAWSYRDLVLLRLLAWLRQLGMPRPKASTSVKEIKSLLSNGIRLNRLGATRETVVLDDAGFTQLGGQNLLPFDDFHSLLRTFDLLEPIEELRPQGRGRAWAPDLVNPSEHTFISPWVLAGEPCLDKTRIPTSAIHALKEERGLATVDIIALYPGLQADMAEDAYLLERRLRGFDLPARAA